MTTTKIIAPYDGRSQMPGTSKSAKAWQQIISPSSSLLLQRHRGDIMRMLLEAWVRDACAAGDHPLVLGGDHSLTWPILRALVDHHGSVTVLHVDAHHDAHPGVELTHWTVFRHIRRRLPVTVIPVGYHRHRPGRRPIDVTAPIEGPIYLSVDVDYFDPRLVPSVSYPVTCDPAHPTDLTRFQEMLSFCHGPVVGADIVEWHGAAEATDEFSFVREVYRVVLETMQGRRGR